MTATITTMATATATATAGATTAATTQAHLAFLHIREETGGGFAPIRQLWHARKTGGNMLRRCFYKFSTGKQ